MSFQTRKTFVYLQNTNDIRYFWWKELSDPVKTAMLHHVQGPKVEKKDIDKIVHVTSVIQL